MRKQAFTAFFAFAIIAFPAWAQEYPQALVPLLEERLKAIKRLQQEDCSPLVSAATQAQVRRTEESIRRLFPAVAAQFDQTGWPRISKSQDEPSMTSQVTAFEPNLQGQDSSPESPSLASPIEVGRMPPSEESGTAVSLEYRAGAGSASESATARNAVSENNPIPMQRLFMELRKDGHALSYTVTDRAEVILGTYLPDDIPSQGGLYLFYFRNTSNHPVDLSARNFALVDQESDKNIKVKTSAEVKAGANPFIKLGKAFGGLLRNTVHLGNGGLRFGHSDESRSNTNNDREIRAEPAEHTAVQVTELEEDADYQSRVALCLQELFVNRSDWRYWVQARALSEYTVKPGEEIIRFVPTGSSNRSHRHVLRFQSGDGEVSLYGAEKGLR